MTSAEPAARAQPSVRGPLLAAVAFFLGNGVVVGALGASLPGLQARLGLTPGGIVAVLALAGGSAIIGMNLTGPLSDRLGVRGPVLASAAVMAVGAALVGTAATDTGLWVGAAVFGLGNGGMDVAMNALGVWVEQRRHRPMMSRLHACFSIGNLSGSLLVVAAGWLLGGGWQTRAPLLLAAGVVVLLAAAVASGVPRRTPSSASDRTLQAESDHASPARMPPAVWLLAVIALCFGLTEGTAVDWSSLHVRHVGGLGPNAAAWGLACVSGTMVAVRLAGDAIVQRVGRARVVGAGSAIALVGYLLTATFSALPAILLGWCLVGLGVGLLGPQVYGLAGHLFGGRGLAVVVSFGYSAFLLGPALIGYVASHVDLQRAMFVPVLTAVALIGLSWRLPRIEASVRAVAGERRD